MAVKKVEPKTIDDNVLVEEMSKALMKRWFPTKPPKGDDGEKWKMISMEDATAIYRHLVKIGVVEELED
jgi:hypothetical protein